MSHSRCTYNKLRADAVANTYNIDHCCTQFVYTCKPSSPGIPVLRTFDLIRLLVLTLEQILLHLNRFMVLDP